MPVTEIIYCLIVIATMFVASTILYQEKKTRIVPAPSLPWSRKKILGLFKDNIPLDSTDKIAELGCGWGGISMALAKQYPNAEIHGFEISFFPYIISKIRALKYGRRVQVHYKNIFKEDLNIYKGIFIYLSPKLLLSLSADLNALPKGTIVISNAFPILEWTPIQTAHTNIGVKIPIFCYSR
jgi:precorrin-6B methylase 2